MANKEVKKKGQQKLDKSMTVDVDNNELVALIEDYVKENTADRLNKLLDCITKGRVLLPAMMNKDKQPAPCLIKNGDGDSYLPVYTDKKQIPDTVKCDGIMNTPYLAANRTAFNEKERVKGIVINPFTHNLIFKMELIERVVEVEERRTAPKSIKLTGEQYVQFERRQFEAGYLPKQFYAQGQTFIDRLCQEQETFIDQLYEESYKEKRMYPYIEEDFSVMVLNVTEELTVVRVDMPERDMAPGLVYRVYLTWNAESRKAGYYRITMGKTRGEVLLEEVTPDIKVQGCGTAPVEGAELQRIVDLGKGEKR